MYLNGTLWCLFIKQNQVLWGHPSFLSFVWDPALKVGDPTSWVYNSKGDYMCEKGNAYIQYFIPGASAYHWQLPELLSKSDHSGIGCWVRGALGRLSTTPALLNRKMMWFYFPRQPDTDGFEMNSSWTIVLMSHCFSLQIKFWTNWKRHICHVILCWILIANSALVDRDNRLTWRYYVRFFRGVWPEYLPGNLQESYVKTSWEHNRATILWSFQLWTWGKNPGCREK